MKEKLNYPDNKRISLDEARKIWGPPRAISWGKAKEIMEENKQLREYRKKISK